MLDLLRRAVSHAAMAPGQDTQRQVLLEERAELLRRELSQIPAKLALLAAASFSEGESGATGPAMPYWQDVAGPEDMGEVYQQILTAVSASDGPVSVSVSRAALGTGTERRNVEALRCRLARLVAPGWLYRPVRAAPTRRSRGIRHPPPPQHVETARQWD
ncbi:hypothetical protein OG705_14065 [Streptomyces sp. NBC_00838]|uniref:hypothetical protein n=1 Tax=Streptomyces sp. NBC_00838 TaxID=2903680 RepID=UPI0038705F03|nr:hypothetical protein OG705_14065 [Streptomyces sp. NBC_00838]